MDDLNCIDCSKVKKFSLNGINIDAKVVSVYDGDTITLVFKFSDKYYKWNCRLDGIDTPEIKSKNNEEKALAVKARDFLREMILGKIVNIDCGDFDKYGRLLVTVTYEKECINDLMIVKGYAKTYFGGTKEIWYEE